jgi:hypothetical protein
MPKGVPKDGTKKRGPNKAPLGMLPYRPIEAPVVFAMVIPRNSTFKGEDFPAGDYMIQDTDGELLAVHKEEFESKYERARLRGPNKAKANGEAAEGVAEAPAEAQVAVN